MSLTKMKTKRLTRKDRKIAALLSKPLSLILLFIIILTFISFLVLDLRLRSPQPIISLDEPFLVIPITVRFNFKLKDAVILRNLGKVNITFYNNEPRQTDATPDKAASGRMVYEGSCALSPDLLTKHKIKFGDIVYIKDLKKAYIVEDKTSEKIKETIDIFVYRNTPPPFSGKLSSEVYAFSIP